MKTSEFIDKVEALGFEAKDFESAVHVCSTGKIIISVSKDYEGVLDTNFSEFKSISWEFRKPVFELAFEYASTPVEKREDEKKYYIRLKGDVATFNYVNVNNKTNEYFMNDKHCVTDFKTQFTKQEIKDFGLQKFADSELFELVEVEK